MEPVFEDTPADAILVLDGIILHRDELAGSWDLSVWLASRSRFPFRAVLPATAHLDRDPSSPRNRRYVEGQRLSVAACQPQERATHVVDNRDLARPFIRR